MSYQNKMFLRFVEGAIIVLIYIVNKIDLGNLIN